MPALCQAAALVDTLLTASLTFYTATTFVYLFCRNPNPDVPSTSEMTLRVSHCYHGTILTPRRSCTG